MFRWVFEEILESDVISYNLKHQRVNLLDFFQQTGTLHRTTISGLGFDRLGLGFGVVYGESCNLQEEG